MAIRHSKYLHSESCKCPFCKAKRGELKGKNNGMHGKKQSALSNKKRRIKMTGEHNPAKRPEVREALRKMKKGKKTGIEPWNKRLTKETDERVKNYGIASGNSRKGHFLAVSTKEKLKIWHITHPNKKFSNTTIERKIAAELLDRKINFQQNIGIDNIANVDFYLPDHNIIIECDGCYYHACHQCGFIKYHQDSIARDAQKTKCLLRNGYQVLRFWEHEINDDIEKCLRVIAYSIQKGKHLRQHKLKNPPTLISNITYTNVTNQRK